MVVLESMAKDIDPDIQILKCAIPFFKFVQDPNIKKQKPKEIRRPLLIWKTDTHFIYLPLLRSTKS